LIYFQNLFTPNFLKVNFYSGNRGAQGLSIISPPNFMLFVCFCMHDIM
jgi:hypothetical protein